jgi:hypothetical protein
MKGRWARSVCPRKTRTTRKNDSPCAELFVNTVIARSPAERFAHLPMTHRLVITSPALPGGVIQLDGHGAERLAKTFVVHR